MAKRSKALPCFRVCYKEDFVCSVPFRGSLKNSFFSNKTGHLISLFNWRVTYQNGIVYEWEFLLEKLFRIIAVGINKAIFKLKNLLKRCSNVFLLTTRIKKNIKKKIVIKFTLTFKMNLRYE